MSKKNTNHRVFLLLLWIFIFSFGGVNAQAPEPDFAWAKRFGNSTYEQRSTYSPSLAVDSQGNSYVSGIILDQSFTLDGITLTGDAHRNNGYIAKYDPNGQIIWAKSTRHIKASEIAEEYNFQKIIIDESGNIYICGTYKTDGQSIINGHYLNPDAPVGNMARFSSYFLAKLDADGEVLWTKITSTLHFGSYFNRRFQNEIHFDLEGNINMAGRFTNYITFHTGDTLTTDTDKSGVFLAKYSPEGELLLNKKLEGDSYHQEQNFEAVRSDASGNLYRWSNYEGNLIGMKKLYRYDPVGELQDSLILNIESTNITSYTRSTDLRGFAVSPTGDVFVGGFHYGGLKINDINYGGYHGTNDYNAVLIKLSAPDYEVEWVRNNITDGIMTSFDRLLTDALGNVYTAGRTGTFYNLQMLFRKYTDSGELLWEKSVDGLYTPQTPNFGVIRPYALCQTKNGGNIWISGYFLANVYFGEGYHYYTATGNGSHFNGFLVQYGLCDTANPIIDTPATTQLCEGESLTLSTELSDTELTYFWSTPTGKVAIEDIGTATLTVTQPGKYYLVAQENDECYGKSQEIWITQAALPNNEVTREEQTLIATEENATYQWLDCDNNNYPIEGATEQTFTPLVSGRYAVEITNASGCSVVSECYEVDVLGIKDIAQSAVVLYPNPATTTLFLETPQQIKRITIHNMAGQTVLKNRNSSEIDISKLAQGLYIITAKTDIGTWKGKFLKK